MIKSHQEDFTGSRKIEFQQAQTALTELFGLGWAITTGIAALAILAVVLALYWFIHSAPPKTLIMTSGPAGSIFEKNAEKYKAILLRNGVALKIIPSEGSLQNLQRLANPSFRVDVGFVENGETHGIDISNLVSLGSLYNQPLIVFYRGDGRVDLLSQFKGKRIAIGPMGSGGHALSLALLAANGIEPGGATKLMEFEAADAAKALLDGKVTAAFMMADSASIDILRRLVRSPGVRLLSFAQADAYTRHFTYLNKMDLPAGAIDFGRNIPAHDVYLIGPTVELIARKNLHPALSDLLLDAAREVHGKAGMFKREGEFPAPKQNDFPLSPEALRFYKSGKSFFYRSLPFWLASLVNRVLVVFLPLIIVLIPILRFIPVVYRWRTNLIFYRWYRVLLVLEQDMIAHLSPKNRQEFVDRLDRIESAVNKIKVPAPFAGQFYELRGHVNFVRSHLTR